MNQHFCYFCNRPMGYTFVCGTCIDKGKWTMMAHFIDTCGRVPPRLSADTPLPATFVAQFGHTFETAPAVASCL